MRHLYTWAGIFAVVLFATAGDVLISGAMKRVGDVGHLFKQQGLRAVIKAMLTNATLWTGVFFMALGFFSLMTALSWNDVSLVGPASASLTFLSNALSAKLFLRERVDRRRWIAALLVASGVALVAL
ncbi:MAG TPA: EamA family transporter [Terriglobales bacterium]|nr:EamA family transporter [Terriglobales bacterium]